LAFLTLLAGFILFAFATPAQAMLCVAKDDVMIAVCEAGHCRLGLVVKWVGAKAEYACSSRPTIADPNVSDPDAAALLKAFALRVPTDGIYRVAASARCLTDGRETPDRCRRLVDLRKVDERSSAGALAAIEDDWRRRQANGIASDKSFEFRLLFRVIVSTIFFAALPWLLPVGRAEFTRSRLTTCLGISLLLGGMKLAVGVWLPTLVLGCLLMSLWLPGLLKRRKPWGLSLTLTHLVALILQLSFALWHFASGSERATLGAPYPEFLDIPSKIGTGILLVAAAASGAYVVISLAKFLIQLFKKHPQTAPVPLATASLATRNLATIGGLNRNSCLDG
jgi:hypothetical protein